MKITVKLLKQLEACQDSFTFGKKHKLFGLEHKEVITKLQELDMWDYSRWLMPRLLTTHSDKVSLALYCAELVIKIYEEKYPDDNRPRQAINATKAWLKNPNEKTAAAAYAAKTDAAYAAVAAYTAVDAYAAVDAAASAAHAAYAAVAAAVYAAFAANAASAAADAASADAAADAADAADRQSCMNKIILKFNKLMDKQEKL